MVFYEGMERLEGDGAAGLCVDCGVPDVDRCPVGEAQDRPVWFKAFLIEGE